MPRILKSHSQISVVKDVNNLELNADGEDEEFLTIRV